LGTVTISDQVVRYQYMILKALSFVTFHIV
jgi:hypothetical protein